MEIQRGFVIAIPILSNLSDSRIGQRIRELDVVPPVGAMLYQRMSKSVKIWRWILKAALVLGADSIARAEVRMAGIFSDDMILQRGMDARAWGMAAPGGKVTVKFAGQGSTATAGNDGAWGVKLKP